MRYVISIVAFIGLIGALVAIKTSQIGLIMNVAAAAKEAGPPPETVSTATAGKTTWAERLTAVGSVEAGKGVAVSNDTSGIVTRVTFESGDAVKAGQVLVELDTSVERAQLASARARLELAHRTLERTSNLVGATVATAADLDSATANEKTAAAEVAALGAQIAKKSVRAPFAGQLGIRLVNVGQFLSPGTAIGTLQSQQDDYVDFTIPQRYLRQLRVGLPVRVEEEHAQLDLRGVVVAIAPNVDQATRAVTLRASVEDPDGRLRPGMFLDVTIDMEASREVVAIPTTAVVHAPYGDSVFVIEKASTAQASASQSADTPRKVTQQFVQLGETRGDFIEVLKGLQGGEVVVSSGAFKLRNEARVKIDNDSVVLDPQLDPHPQNR